MKADTKTEERSKLASPALGSSLRSVASLLKRLPAVTYASRYADVPEGHFGLPG